MTVYQGRDLPLYNQMEEIFIKGRIAFIVLCIELQYVVIQICVIVIVKLYLQNPAQILACLAPIFFLTTSRVQGKISFTVVWLILFICKTTRSIPVQVIYATAVHLRDTPAHPQTSL